MSVGIWQLVIILIIVLILFGRGKISQIMGEFGKGIKSFKKEVKNPEQLSDKSSTDKSGKAKASPNKSKSVKATKKTSSKK